MSDQGTDGAPADRLTLEASADGDGTSLRVGGEIDVFTAPSLAERLATATAVPATHVTVDLADVSFIDSTGLRVLIEADRAMRDRGGVLVLLRPSHVVSRLLELTALGDWLTVEPAVAEPGVDS